MPPSSDQPNHASSDRTNGLFSSRFLEDDGLDDAPSGSLSAFIAERLKTRGQEAQDEGTASNDAAPIPLPFEPSGPSGAKASQNQAKSKGPTGMVLRHLDSQLVNAHLEQYLPTASTRYYLMRERLFKELEALDGELYQLKKLNIPEDQKKIETLETRVTFLKEKLKGLDIVLSEMNPFQGVYHWVQQFSKAAPIAQKGSRSLWAWIPNATRAMADEMSQINTELQTLESILSEQLHDPCFTPDQLGQLINNYDRYLKQTEKLIAQHQSRTSLHSRLNTALARWYRKWFELTPTAPQSE